MWDDFAQKIQMCGKIHVAGPGRIKIKNKTLKKPIKSSESGQSLGCSDRKNRFFFLYKKTILFGRSNNEQLLNSPFKLYRWQPWCTLINYENIKNVHFPLFLFCLKPLHSYAVISNSNNVSFFFFNFKSCCRKFYNTALRYYLNYYIKRERQHEVFTLKVVYSIKYSFDHRFMILEKKNFFFCGYFNIGFLAIISYYSTCEQIIQTSKNRSLRTTIFDMTILK